MRLNQITSTLLLTGAILALDRAHERYGVLS